jgi:hypothetical protein
LGLIKFIQIILDSTLFAVKKQGLITKTKISFIIQDYLKGSELNLGRLNLNELIDSSKTKIKEK